MKKIEVKKNVVVQDAKVIVSDREIDLVAGGYRNISPW